MWYTTIGGPEPVISRRQQAIIDTAEHQQGKKLVALANPLVLVNDDLCPEPPEELREFLRCIAGEEPCPPYVIENASGFLYQRGTKAKEEFTNRVARLHTKHIKT